MRKYVYKSDSVAIDILKDCNAFQCYSGNAFINNQKIHLNSPPILDNQEFWLSEEFIEKAYSDCDITKTITREICNKKYYSLKDFCDNTIKANYFEDIKREFVIIGNRDFEEFKNLYINYEHPQNYHLYNRGELAYIEAVNYLIYERPNNAQILKLAKKMREHHPRVLANKNTFHQAINFSKNEKYIEHIIKDSEKMLNDPLMEYKLTDGERIDHAGSVSARIEKLSFCYLCTNNNKYKKRIYKEIEAMNNMKDWNAWHFLDVAGCLSGCAIAYDWLYDKWTDEERKFIADTMLEKGMKVAYNDFYGAETKQWTGFVNNWIIVCGAAIVCAAAALFDDYPELCSELIEMSLRGLEYMYPFFYPDGGWGEGPGYWEYANKWFIYYMMTLRNLCGTDFGYYDQPGVKNTSYYIAAIHGAWDSFNFHDALQQPYNVSSMSGHSFMQSNDDISSLRKQMIEFYGFVPDILDVLYLNHNVQKVELPLDMYFRNVETGMMRDKWFDKNSTYLGYHAGLNAPVHRNYDSGCFIFDSNGIRWACDLGGDKYSLPGYWDYNTIYYRLRAEGHNVYVINPDETPGQNFKNKDVILEVGEAYAKADITSSYERDVNYAYRSYYLTDNRKNLKITDELELKEQSEFYWFLHTQADIEITENGAILKKDGKKMNFEYNSNQPLEIYTMDAVPLDTTPKAQNTPNEGIRKIVLYGKVSGVLKITAQLKG